MGIEQRLAALERMASVSPTRPPALFDHERFQQLYGEYRQAQSHLSPDDFLTAYAAEIVAPAMLALGREVQS